MKKHFLKPFSKQKFNSGFSLVEVLLAVVLLAIIVTPLMQVIISSMSTNQKSRELMAATNFAETIMEYCESKPFGSGSGDGLVKDSLDNPGTNLNLSCFPGLIPTENLNMKADDPYSNSYTTGGYGVYDGFQAKCIQKAYTALSVPGAVDADYKFYYNSQDDLDWYCFMAYKYDGYKFDAYVTFTPVSVTESLDYVVYNINVDVYGRDKNATFADHSTVRKLVSLQGSTFDSLEAD